MEGRLGDLGALGEPSGPEEVDPLGGRGVGRETVVFCVMSDDHLSQGGGERVREAGRTALVHDELPAPVGRLRTAVSNASSSGIEMTELRPPVAEPEVDEPELERGNRLRLGRQGHGQSIVEQAHRLREAAENGHALTVNPQGTN